MPIFDQSTAECLVFTYKEGLLSPVAHDLKIQVTQFEISIPDSEDSVAATFDATSLRVGCAMKDGEDMPKALSKRDKRKTEANINKDVLRSRRFPQIVFRATSVVRKSGQCQLEGELTLCGETRAIQLNAELGADGWTTETWINQPDFGIKPFTALMGTMKVKPRVKVWIRIPLTES